MRSRSLTLKTHVLLLFLILSAYNSVAFSQTDTKFWFAAPHITRDHSAPGGLPMNLNLTACVADAVVTLSFPNNVAMPIKNYAIAKGEFLSIDLNAVFGQDNVENVSGTDNGGMLIESTNLITAYYQVDNEYNRDIFTLKGKNSLGTNFIIPAQNIYSTWSGHKAYSGFCIVATEDDTEVVITPTAEVAGGHLANVVYTVNLQKGQVYTAQSINFSVAGRLGGSTVTSDKAVAITIYDDSVQAPDGCGDMYGDQLIPIPVAGNEYLVMRGLLGSWTDTPPADNVITKTQEYVFIYQTVGFSVITITTKDGVTILPATAKKECIRVAVDHSYLHIKSDSPIYVFHWTGFGCEIGGAVLPTIDGCTGSSSVSFTRSSADPMFMNIMAKGKARKGFVIQYDDGSEWNIPEDYFEPVIGVDWWILKKDKKKFIDAMGGGIPRGKPVTLKNTLDVFHLGVINGTTGSGCKYGYFSDYGVSETKVDVNDYNTGSIKYLCNDDPIKLLVSGGKTFTWSSPINPSHLAYLSDPYIANPLLTVPQEGDYSFDCLVSRPCKADTVLKVNIHILKPSIAKFDIDANTVCSPKSIKFTNLSDNVLENRWDFKGDFVIDKRADKTFDYTYDNTTNVPISYKVSLTTLSPKGCTDRYERTLIVYPQIKADFDVDIFGGCNPVEVNFTDKSTGNTDKDQYIWSFGDGASSILQSPTHTFYNIVPRDTIYKVKLITESPYHCIDSSKAEITVRSYIDAAFTVDDTKGCAPYNMNVNNVSKGDVKAIEWTFDDGTPLSATTDKTFVHTYQNITAAPIIRNVKLVTTNAAGCTDTDTREITVYPEVKSEFVIDKNIGCDSLKASFTNNSFGYNLSYIWDFGDKGTSATADKTLTHIYTNKDPLVEQTYKASLTVTSTIGSCVSKSEHDVTIYKYVKADFSIPTGLNCSPHSAEIFNNSIGGNQFDWNFGDATLPETHGTKKDFTHIFENTDLNIPKEYSVNLKVSNGGQCESTITRNVKILPPVTADFDITSVSNCAPVEVTITNNVIGGALAHTWDFGDGQTLSSADKTIKHIYSNRTNADITYKVKYAAKNPFGCFANMEKDIVINPEVDASFTFTKNNECTPLPVTITNNSLNGNSFNWDMGDGSALFTKTDKINFDYSFSNAEPNKIKTYNINVVATDTRTGCTDNIAVPIDVYPLLVSDFSVDKVDGCNPITVNFANNSTGLGFYQWDFGDLSSSNLDNPTHTYSNYDATDKVFDITLKTTNPLGCVETSTKKVTVFPYVKSNFDVNVSAGCTPLEIEFKNYSKGNVSNIWSLGDGTTSADALPGKITYINNDADEPLENKEYTIDLKVVNAHGCEDVYSKVVTVYPRTQPNFNYTAEGCHPLNVVFDNTTVKDNLTSYKWKFSDGSKSYILNPVKDFLNFDTSSDKKYSVKLVSESQYGCKDSIQKELVVYPKPLAKMDMTTVIGCSPLLSTFANKSKGTDLMYNWDLKDGTIISTTSADPFTHTFDNKTDDTYIYDIELAVETQHGCKDVVNDKVFVYPKPVADFSMQQEGCSPVETEFKNLSSSVAYRYLWDFKDGTTSVVDQPTHRFDNISGTDKIFNVSLLVTSKFNCTDEISKPINVFATPIAEFKVKDFYKDFPNSSFDISNLTTDGTWDYVWTFGDNNKSYNTEREFVYTYNYWAPNSEDNIYKISLEAANTVHPECKSKALHQVILKPPLPIIKIKNDKPSGCAPFTVDFTVDYSWATSYEWNFGDGQQSNQLEPTHTFTKAGVYFVSLTLTGDGGKSTDFVTVTAYAVPEVEFDVAPNLVMLPNEPIKCYNKTQFGDEYVWDFGDGNSSTEINPIYQYKEVGLYDIQLSAKNKYGCNSSLVKNQLVEVIGDGFIKFPNSFIPDKYGSNGGYYSMPDSKNIVFHPAYQGVRDYHLVVFNRNGEMIFETKDISVGWDGYFNGKMCTQGVYVWRVKGSFNNNKKFEFYGDAFLIR